MIYLAFQGGELVGMRGFYHFRWELGSPPEEYSVLVADDAVIVPQHRNRGLATMIMRAAFEDLARSGHQYVFNLSGGIVTVVGSLVMGWKSAGAMEPISLERIESGSLGTALAEANPFLAEICGQPVSAIAPGAGAFFPPGSDVAPAAGRFNPGRAGTASRCHERARDPPRSRRSHTSGPGP